ncbi:hypothetical protein [Clostridium sp.]|uniref:hypothetical protein n=1 Tax=Clostridium sp. TaxID=1506 RepID=UPI003216D70A
MISIQTNKILTKYGMEVVEKENGGFAFKKSYDFSKELSDWENTTSHSEFSFMKRSDLQKICESENYILNSRHNESPTIKEFINIKEQIFLDGRVEMNNGSFYIDIDAVHIPLEYDNNKFNKILNSIGYCADSIEKRTENYKDYLYLWWD